MPAEIALLENAWYCAAWSHEIGPRGVLGRTILKRRLAFFRDNSRHLHAIAAVCPHRGSDLSRGRVVDQTLECPLHGWCFDKDGRCVAVPSQPSSLRISSQACVPAYLVREQQGVVWIWIGQQREPVPEPPRYDVWDAGRDRRRQFMTPKLWKCSFINAVENAIDTTHVAFVHQRSLGSGQRRLYPRQQIAIDDDLRGFSGEDDPNSPWGGVRTAEIVDGRVGRLITRLLGMDQIRREHYRFDLGGSLYYQIHWKSGTWDALVAHSTPADDSHTWFFGVTIRTRATHFLGDVAQRWFNAMLIAEDETAVTAMLSNEAGALPSPVSVAADEPVLTFRRIHAHHLRRERASRAT